MIHLTQAERRNPSGSLPRWLSNSSHQCPVSNDYVGASGRFVTLISSVMTGYTRREAPLSAFARHSGGDRDGPLDTADVPTPTVDTTVDEPSRLPS